MAKSPTGFVQSTIEWEDYRAAIMRCARDSADKHLKEADQHLKEARAIMAEAREPAQDILAKAQEPIFQFEIFPCGSCMLDATDVEEVPDNTEVLGEVLDNKVHGAYAIASQIRPSKAPRLR